MIKYCFLYHKASPLPSPPLPSPPKFFNKKMNLLNIFIYKKTFVGGWGPYGNV
jgi:hypothetical protein